MASPPDVDHLANFQNIEAQTNYCRALESKARDVMYRLEHDEGKTKQHAQQALKDMIVNHGGQLHGAVCEITDYGEPDASTGVLHYSVKVIDREVFPSFEGRDIMPDLSRSPLPYYPPSLGLGISKTGGSSSSSKSAKANKAKNYKSKFLFSPYQLELLSEEDAVSHYRASQEKSLDYEVLQKRKRVEDRKSRKELLEKKIAGYDLQVQFETINVAVKKMLEKPPAGFEHFLPAMERAFLRNYPTVIRKRLQEFESDLRSGKLKARTSNCYGTTTEYSKASDLKKDLDAKYAELATKHAVPHSVAGAPASAEAAQRLAESKALQCTPSTTASASANSTPAVEGNDNPHSNAKLGDEPILAMSSGGGGQGNVPNNLYSKPSNFSDYFPAISDADMDDGAASDYVYEEEPDFDDGISDNGDEF